MRLPWNVLVSGGDEEITFPIQTCTRAGDVRNAQQWDDDTVTSWVVSLPVTVANEGLYSIGIPY